MIHTKFGASSTRIAELARVPIRDIPKKIRGILFLKDMAIKFNYQRGCMVREILPVPVNL